MRVLDDKIPYKVEVAFLVGYHYLQILPHGSVLDKEVFRHSSFHLKSCI